MGERRAVTEEEWEDRYEDGGCGRHPVAPEWEDLPVVPDLEDVRLVARVVRQCECDAAALQLTPNMVERSTFAAARRILAALDAKEER